MFLQLILCGAAGSRRLVLVLRLPRLLLASPPRRCCSHDFCVYLKK